MLLAVSVQVLVQACDATSDLMRRAREHEC